MRSARTRRMHCHWDVADHGNLTFSCRTNAAHPFRFVTGQLTGSDDPERPPRRRTW